MRKFDTVRVRQLPYVLLCCVTLRAQLQFSYNPTDSLIGHTCYKPWPSDTRFSPAYVMVSRIVCRKTCTASTDMVATIFLYEIYIKYPFLFYFMFLFLFSPIFTFLSLLPFFYSFIFAFFLQIFFSLILFYFSLCVMLSSCLSFLPFFASSLTFYLLPYFSHLVLFHLIVLYCPFCL